MKEAWRSRVNNPPALFDTRLQPRVRSATAGRFDEAGFGRGAHRDPAQHVIEGLDARAGA